MEHKYIYKTKFYFDNEVWSIREANEFFADECEWGPWFKEDIADWIGKDEANKIVDFAWCVTRKKSGCIRVVSTEELSDQALETLSKWIKHKCDSLEEDIFDFTDAFNYNVFWGSSYEYNSRNGKDGWVRVHFDHEGSDYKLKLVKVE